jgi:hypothetical protein
MLLIRYLTKQFNPLRYLNTSASLAMVLLSLLLILSQGIYLVHIHEASLLSQVEQEADCDVCLKFGSTGGSLITKSPEFETENTQSFSPDLVLSPPFVAIPANKARAPPAV